MVLGAHGIKSANDLKGGPVVHSENPAQILKKFMLKGLMGLVTCSIVYLPLIFQFPIYLEPLAPRQTKII